MDTELLNTAVAHGIIDRQQADALLELARQEAAAGPPPDTSGEQLRFIRSFGDIFIALGVVLIAFTASRLTGSLNHCLAAIGGFVLIAEWLVGRRRLALPGIAILLSILHFVNRAVDFAPQGFDSLDVLLMGLTSLVFYFRYRMPFSLYPFAVSCIYLCIRLAGIDVISHPGVFVLLGVAVFCAAMWYDSRDTARITTFSDNAFWLHLLAAPLIVHGVMVSLFLSGRFEFPASSIAILLLFTLFFFVALFVDRRAILVSSFAYALYAVFRFALERLTQVDNLTLFIFMGVGLFVIFFGTYWYRVRSLVFRPIAGWRISRLVPGFDDR